MELEFDKEIDAILRKARPNRGVLVGDSPDEPKKHLDADAIAAFAENALPQKARLLYMEHFAACDDCRKQLSFAILANSEMGPTTASTGVTAIETALPWYSKLFRTPNLALAMGILVLAFGGILGYVVLQNRQGEATISQVSDKPIAHPPFSDRSVTNSNLAPANAMTAANTAVEANAAANSMANVSAYGTGRAVVSGGPSPATTDPEITSSDSVVEASKPVAAAPPPLPASAPKMADKSVVDHDNQQALADDRKAKAEEKDDRARNESENRIAREAVPPATKKSGPQRSGPAPINNQQYNVDGADMASGGMAAKSPVSVKTAGGKKFENRNGAWYDTSYRGQGTTNFRRGTDEYKKLEGGLRSIADSVGGTVVVVWKGKAYRVQ